MVDRDPVSGIQRRVAGAHNVRMEGLYDLILRARGMSVFDVGCNRGMVGYEFANNGARLVHGCDSYDKGIETAREVFSDIRNVQSKFEIVNLAEGPAALRKAFGQGEYDLVLLLAIVHKLKRIMTDEALRELLVFLGKWAGKYVGGHVKESEFKLLDECMDKAGLVRIHTSFISEEAGPGLIWKRVK